MPTLHELLAAEFSKRMKKKLWDITADANMRQWWSREKIVDYSHKKLRELTAHAQLNVKYYTDLFERSNISAESLDIRAEWNKIPLLDKDLLRKNYQDLIASTPHRLNARKNASGGSTGKPVSFLSDRQLFDIMFAQMNVMFSWAGWKPGEGVFHFWGNDEKQLNLNWRGRLSRFLNRNYIYPVYFYDEKTFEFWWGELNRHRPRIIYAYPSVLSQFASWLLDKGYEYRGIKGVFTSAEVLYPNQRALIEKAFACKVFNQYGSREAPAIACECPEGNMHCFTDLNYIEFQDAPDSDGAKEIIVTPLFNYAQPLIRYNLMDMGRPMEGACPCGRGYPLMSMEIGRTNDQVTGLDGGKVFPSFLLHLLDGELWIRSYQFRQKRLDLFELAVEPEDPADCDLKSADLKNRILPLMREKLGGAVELNIAVVDKIERNRAGKHRFVINEIGN